jgi:hypothetical protein
MLKIDLRGLYGTQDNPKSVHTVDCRPRDDPDGSIMDATGVASTDIPPECAKYVKVFATGLRNSYDFVFHSSGNLLATENALGVTASFPVLPAGYQEGK